MSMIESWGNDDLTVPLTISLFRPAPPFRQIIFGELGRLITELIAVPYQQTRIRALEFLLDISADHRYDQFTPAQAADLSLDRGPQSS
jgi:hypothetical protein